MNSYSMRLIVKTIVDGGKYVVVKNDKHTVTITIFYKSEEYDVVLTKNDFSIFRLMINIEKNNKDKQIF